MSTVFYSMCGEGLGHSARAISLIEYLPQHDFHVFTYADGYNFIKDLNLPNIKKVYNIDGLEFAVKGGKISTYGTFKGVVKFLFQKLGKNKKFMKDKVDEIKPDLFLVDWEPILPRVARKLKIPCISIDSQHKFRFDHMKGFPFWLRLYSGFAYFICRLMIPKVDHYILSTFQSDLIERRKGVTLSQCFVRKTIADIKPKNDGHLLVYVRQPEIASKIIESLLNSESSNSKIICYGVHLEDLYPQVIFKKRSYLDFANDLAGCEAVFTTAGIQLVGEARYYGKPSFVVPIPGQYEQYVNARYVDVLRLGVSSSFDEISSQTVNEFLDTYKEGIPFSDNGVHNAIQVIKHYLN